MQRLIVVVRTVTAPTAVSPAKRRSVTLKLTATRFSVICMRNGESPSARQGRRSFMSGRRFFARSRSVDFSEQRKRTTHAHETACERIVASAAPRTPMPNTNMNSGSSTMLSAAPIVTVSMLVVEKPCAVMKALSPSESCTKIVPRL